MLHQKFKLKSFTTFLRPTKISLVWNQYKRHKIEIFLQETQRRYVPANSTGFLDFCTWKTLPEKSIDNSINLDSILLAEFNLTGQNCNAIQVWAKKRTLLQVSGVFKLISKYKYKFCFVFFFNLPCLVRTYITFPLALLFWSKFFPGPFTKP